MATETKPLPALALSAFNQLQTIVNTASRSLFTQTLEAMGLPATDGWTLDLPNQCVHREVPDAPADALIAEPPA